MLVRCWGLALLLATLTALATGCGAPLRDVRVAENQASVAAGQELGLGGVAPFKLFRQGKRISILRATLFVREPGALRKVQVVEGDDIILGGKRWLVAKIIEGGPTTRAEVVLREAR